MLAKFNEEWCVYIDLEDTLIDSWYTPEPLWDNSERIKSFLKHIPYKKVGIFSHAIHNQFEVAEFDDNLRQVAEHQTGCYINLRVPSVAEMHKELFGFEDTSCVSKYLRYLTKADSFRRYVKLKHQNRVIVLLDDDVDTSFEYDSVNNNVVFTLNLIDNHLDREWIKQVSNSCIKPETRGERH